MQAMLVTREALDERNDLVVVGNVNRADLIGQYAVQHDDTVTWVQPDTFNIYYRFVDAPVEGEWSEIVEMPKPVIQEDDGNHGNEG